MKICAKLPGIETPAVANHLALVDAMWAGISADTSAFPWMADQRARLARREADDELRPEDAVAAEVVFLDVRARLAKRK